MLTELVLPTNWRTGTTATADGLLVVPADVEDQGMPKPPLAQLITWKPRPWLGARAAVASA